MKAKNQKNDTATPSASEEMIEPPSVALYSTTDHSVSLSTILENRNPVSESTKKFIARYFPATTINEWNNWRWQMRNSISTPERLTQFLTLTSAEAKAFEENQKLPFRITPYYLSLMCNRTEDTALRKTMIPDYQELSVHYGETTDPLNEAASSVLPNLVHRYPDRVLFLVTNRCSAYCRYCTRTHMVSEKENRCNTKTAWDNAIAYIANHKEVRDVLVSGGDPLTLPDSQLEYLISSLRAIPHVEIIRIGSKMPMVLPSRITPQLTDMLKKYHPLFMSIHITHPDEFTPEAKDALNKLADAGIVLGSQTVLLKNVNDDPAVFMKLVHQMLMCRVRPYYLYQCDPVPGTFHFRTPVEKGLEIIHSLRGFTSGYAIPHFVIDAPNGGGKIPLLPNYVTGHDKGNVYLKNYLGDSYSYPDTAQ